MNRYSTVVPGQAAGGLGVPYGIRTRVAAV